MLNVILFTTILQNHSDDLTSFLNSLRSLMDILSLSFLLRARMRQNTHSLFI